MSEVYDDLRYYPYKFNQLKKALQNVMMTNSYISITDIISMTNFIHELYPGYDMDRINKNLDLKDLKILGYRILLT
jgi:hypothetical protein